MTLYVGKFIDLSDLVGDRCPTFFYCDGSTVFHKIPISSPGVLSTTDTTPELPQSIMLLSLSYTINLINFICSFQDINRKQNCSNKLKAEGRSLLDVTHPYITHNEGDLCHMKQLRCESIFLSDWL